MQAECAGSRPARLRCVMRCASRLVGTVLSQGTQRFRGLGLRPKPHSTVRSAAAADRMLHAASLQRSVLHRCGHRCTVAPFRVAPPQVRLNPHLAPRISVHNFAIAPADGLRSAGEPSVRQLRRSRPAQMRAGAGPPIPHLRRDVGVHQRRNRSVQHVFRVRRRSRISSEYSCSTHTFPT